MATPIPANHAAFTTAELLEATGGRLVGPKTIKHTVGVVTDSRHVTPGSLFVALSGENFDAHGFLPDVARLGAGAAIVRAGATLPSDLSAIEVADPLRALGQLARFHRLRWGKTIVAITGSAGKTTTKELTAAALMGVGRRVLKTTGNLNNAIGVPMTLFQLAPEHDIAVVEVGTSGRGEIAWLAEIARPDVGVVTEVAPAHTAGLGTVADVAAEKTDLLRALSAQGAAIWNADNEHIAPALGALDARQITYGTAEGIGVRLVSHEVTAGLRERCRFEVREASLTLDAELRMIGDGPALDAAAALAATWVVCGAQDLARAAVAMATLEPTAGRMFPRVGREGVLYVDDTYNANPISCERSLRTAAAVARARSGRVIAVLGDMKELGEQSVAQHRRLGRLAVELEVAAFVGCGPEMGPACDAAMQESARRRLPAATLVMHVLDPLGAVPMVQREVEAADVVLIKGSRSMAMERIVNALCPEGAAS